MDERDPGERITKFMQVGEVVWRNVAADLSGELMRPLVLTVNRKDGERVDYEVVVRRVVS